MLGELGAGAYHGRHAQQRWRLELMAEGSMLCWPLLWLAVNQSFDADTSIPGPILYAAFVHESKGK